MNFRFVDPADYIQGVPTDLSASFVLSLPAWTGAFSPTGNVLAISYNTGNIEMWDFQTRSPIYQVKPFMRCVNSVSWTPNGKHLWFSVGLESTVGLLDAASGKVENTWNVGEGVWAVYAHPVDSTKCLVFCVDSVSVLSNDVNERIVIDGITSQKAKSASFNFEGDKVYCGYSRGVIGIFSSKDGKLLEQFKIKHSSVDVLDLKFSARGNYFLVNNRNTLRIFSTVSNEIVSEIPNVTGGNWQSCCFSGRPVIRGSDWDSQYVVGASGNNIVIWNLELRTVQNQLEKPKKIEDQYGILALDWHPTHPMMICVTMSEVYIFSMEPQPRWSHYEPLFTELEANVYYEEKEDEFDIIEDEDKTTVVEKNDEEESEMNVNIISTPKEMMDDDDYQRNDVMSTVPIQVTDDVQISETTLVKIHPTISSRSVLRGEYSWPPS